MDIVSQSDLEDKVSHYPIGRLVDVNVSVVSMLV